MSAPAPMAEPWLWCWVCRAAHEGPDCDEWDWDYYDEGGDDDTA